MRKILFLSLLLIPFFSIADEATSFVDRKNSCKYSLNAVKCKR